MDMSPYAEPLPTELEQIVDEVHRDCGQGPAARPAATGIADMEARLRYHTILLAKLRQQPATLAVTEHIAASEHQLAEARDRLAEYQLQDQGKN